VYIEKKIDCRPCGEGRLGRADFYRGKTLLRFLAEERRKKPECWKKQESQIRLEKPLYKTSYWRQSRRPKKEREKRTRVRWGIIVFMQRRKKIAIEHDVVESTTLLRWTGRSIQSSSGKGRRASPGPSSST